MDNARVSIDWPNAPEPVHPVPPWPHFHKRFFFTSGGQSALIIPEGQPKELFMQKARVTFVAAAVGAGLSIALLAGCGKNSSQTETPGAPAAAPVVAAEKNSFNEVTSHLDTGGNLYLYLGTAQWLDGLSGKASSWRGSLESFPGIKDDDRANMLHAFDLVTNLIKDSGIEDVSGLGVSSVEFEKGLYRTKTVLHHYPGRGNGLIWTAFGAQPHKLDGIDLLPTTTAFAMFSDTDFQQLWAFVEKELTQAEIPGVGDALEKVRSGFEVGTGLKLDDTLASLGGEYGFIITLDDDKIVEFPGGPNGTIKFPQPGILLALKVKDNLIFDRLETVLKSSGMQMTQTDKDGLKMRTVGVPIPIPMNLRPSIARSGDYLFLSTSDTLIEQVLAVQSGKESGLKSTDEFKKLQQNVPEEGNSFAFVSKRFGQTWLDLQEQITDRTAMNNPGQGQLIRKLAALNPPADAFSVAANTAEGWMGTGNGSQDGAKLALVPLVAVPAVLAGVALPAFAKAKAKSQEVACKNNIRQLQIAKQMWAQDKNKSTQDTPTWDDLKPYLGGANIKCPSGGEYELNSVGEQPTCSVHSHGQNN
jgi:hypothetical protein